MENARAIDPERGERSVYGTEGAYTLATLSPTALMKMFGSAELESVAEEVERVIKAMMQDAAEQP